MELYILHASDPASTLRLAQGLATQDSDMHDLAAVYTLHDQQSSVLIRSYSVTYVCTLHHSKFAKRG